MIRETPLEAPDVALWDRHSNIWDSVMSTLLDRPLPTVLSAPCGDCGKFEIVCDCMENDDDAC